MKNIKNRKSTQKRRNKSQKDDKMKIKKVQKDEWFWLRPFMLTTRYISIFVCFVLATLAFAQGINPSQNIKAPFNVNEIIEKVSHQTNERYCISSPLKGEDHACPEPSRRGEGNYSRDDEFLVDTSVVYGPASAWQYYSDVAFDGENYLVVWTDQRNGSCDIYGARVSQSGVLLDSVGISISTTIGNQARPVVVFGDTSYFVAWADGRNGSGYDIYGARVSKSGVVLDPDGILISQVAYWGIWGLDIAFDGTNYLVVWGDAAIRGRRVSQSGTVLDPTNIAISIGLYESENPAVAFDGFNYLVVWEAKSNSLYSYDIYGARVSQAGTLLDPAGFIISDAAHNQYCPAIAFGGANYLVVWDDQRNNDYFDVDVYGARVTPDGLVLDASGIPISTAPNHQQLPAVAFDGTNYLVVWHHGDTDLPDIYGARVDQAGTVLDPAGIVISANQNSYEGYPSIAFGGANYSVVWHDSRSFAISGYDIYGARVDLSGVVLDTVGIAISTSANEQKKPAVAFDGTNYLIAWVDSRSGSSYDIYGARVGHDGTLLDPTTIAISTAPDRQVNPSIAFDGTNYFVVWEDYRSGVAAIYGARVSQAGTVLDPSGIPISTNGREQGYPTIAYGGASYLVVWEDCRDLPYSPNIYGARVDQAGTVLDPAGIPISTANWYQKYPSIAFGGTDYFVVWKDNRTGSQYYDIYGARVDQTGAVLDPDGIAICTAASQQSWPGVAFDGTNYLVVWQDKRNWYFYNIYGARVDQTGAVLDPNGIAISNVAGQQYYPAVVFDSTNYLVVWQDYRSGSNFDIYAAAINPNGIVIDSFVVSTQSKDQVTPALALGQDNQILITYSGWTDSINTHPANTMRIWGDFYYSTGMEENALLSTPNTIRQLQVYPNPFRNETVINYALSSKHYAENNDLPTVPLRSSENPRSPNGTYSIVPTIRIYDASGRLVKNFDLVSCILPLTSAIAWNGTDDYGRKLPAGIYFIHLETEYAQEVEKIIKLK